MHRTLLGLTLAVLAVLVAAPAGAQGLKLAFNQGLVSVDATAVPVKTILNEWSKLGGTKVVGAEKISGTPLTLKLVDVPEAQALDIILRSVAGYMVAPRGVVAGASIFDRILVMATSTPPASTAAGAARPNAPAGPGANAGTQRFIPPRPIQRQADEIDPDDEQDPNPPNPPAFTFPQPGQQGFPPGLPGGPGGPGNPIITVNPATGAPQSITINPAPIPTAPSGRPTTPFGTTGATAPGMIQQPVQPGQPGQPGPMVRPPG